METIKRNAALFFSLLLLTIGIAHILTSDEHPDPVAYGFIIVAFLLLPICFAHRKKE